MAASIRRTSAKGEIETIEPHRRQSGWLQVEVCHMSAVSIAQCATVSVARRDTRGVLRSRRINLQCRMSDLLRFYSREGKPHGEEPRTRRGTTEPAFAARGYIKEGEWGADAGRHRPRMSVVERKRARSFSPVDHSRSSGRGKRFSSRAPSMSRSLAIRPRSDATPSPSFFV